MGNRAVPWIVIVQEGQRSAKTLVWANSEESATRKAMKKWKDDFRDGQDLRIPHGVLTIMIRRSRKQEANGWQKNTIR